MEQRNKLLEQELKQSIYTSSVLATSYNESNHKVAKGVKEDRGGQAQERAMQGKGHGREGAEISRPPTPSQNASLHSSHLAWSEPQADGEGSATATHQGASRADASRYSSAPAQLAVASDSQTLFLQASQVPCILRQAEREKQREGYGRKGERQRQRQRQKRRRRQRQRCQIQ